MLLMLLFWIRCVVVSGVHGILNGGSDGVLLFLLLMVCCCCC